MNSRSSPARPLRLRPLRGRLLILLALPRRTAGRDACTQLALVAGRRRPFLQRLTIHRRRALAQPDTLPPAA